MLELYLVRHGQTALSRENGFSGTTDVPLSDVGRRMAQALADCYARFPFRAIYASPRTRAIETVRPLAERQGQAMKIDAGLAEIAYGAWEGRSEDEVEREQPEAFRAWAERPDLFAPPGGETAVQIAARAIAAIERIRARHADGPVLVASHKATLRILVCSFLGVPLGEFRRRIGWPVAAMAVVEYRDTGPLLKVLGDTSHLPPELRAARGT